MGLGSRERPEEGKQKTVRDSGSVEAAGYYEGVMEARDYDEGGDEVGKVVDQ